MGVRGGGERVGSGRVGHDESMRGRSREEELDGVEEEVVRTSGWYVEGCDAAGET